MAIAAPTDRSGHWLLGALIAAAAVAGACSRPPLPAGGDGGADLPAPAPDLALGDARSTGAGTMILLAPASQPILDGVTADGEVLAFHDGATQYAVNTFPGVAPFTLAQQRDPTLGAVVSGDAVVSFYQRGSTAVKLNAWAAGDPMPTELEVLAYPNRDAIAASPDGRYVAYVTLTNVDGTQGNIEIRPRTNGKPGAAIIPTDVRAIDVSQCLTTLRFYDNTHLVAFYCSHADLVPRLSVVDVVAATTTALSQPQSGEKVDQVAFVPGARILWTNQLTSAVDPGALKSATPDGSVRQVLVPRVPPKQVAQLTLSPAGDAAYYLGATGILNRVDAQSGKATSLSTDKVDRIAGISPDNTTIAVVHAHTGATGTDRLSLIDTTGAASPGIDPPLGSGLTLASGTSLFTADSAYVLYISDNDHLYAYPVRGTRQDQRVTVATGATTYAPLSTGQVLVLRGLTAGTVTATVMDVRNAMLMDDRGHGIPSSPSGSWAVVPDRSRLLFVSGGNVYMSTLP